MKKRDWFIVIGLVFVACILDQVTKQWAVANVRGLHFSNGFGLVLHRNPGAMLGMFSNLPPLLRIVSLSTGGAFLIFVYTSLQYLLPSRSLTLRIGMSLLLGGILGNVLDRIVYGSIVDFLILGTPKHHTPAFNLADAIQWVGYVLAVGTLLVKGQEIWPNNDFRKRLWINPKFQSKYIFVLIFVGLSFAIISCVYSFTFLKVTIDDLVVGNASLVEKKFLFPFLITYSIISMSFVIVLFIVGRQLSHRMAGPVYAFERFLQDISAGRDRSFKVRMGDEFSQLEEVASVVRFRILDLEQQNQELIEKLEALEENFPSA